MVVSQSQLNRLTACLADSVAFLLQVPSGVKKDPARRRYTLLFYGTKESASLDGRDLCLYEENKEIFGKPNPIAGFNAAIREVEEEISHKVDTHKLVDNSGLS